MSGRDDRSNGDGRAGSPREDDGGAVSVGDPSGNGHTSDVKSDAAADDGGVAMTGDDSAAATDDGVVDGTDDGGTASTNEGVADGTDEDADRGRVATRRTRRWRGVLVIALGAVGLGLIGNRPGLIVLGTVGAVYAAYPWLTGPPDPALTIDRRLSDDNPAPDEEFSVTTTLRNDGRWPLFDVRFVDGVPAALHVTDGTPRRGTFLLPGGSTTVEYTVAAREGRHAFEPATVVVRDASGEHEAELSVGTDTTVECRSGVDGAPVRAQTLQATGQIPSMEGGSGIEFHRTRRYRPGDPMGRIDWNRFARTAELTTIDFREERSASIVVLVDAREPCYRGASGEPHAVARSVSAAQELVDELITSRNRVGLAAVGPVECWLAPDTGRHHRTRAQRLLAEHAAFSPSPPTDTVSIEGTLASLQRRLPRTAQVLLCSPLLDDGAVEVARRLDAEGHAVGVISPDVTDSGSAGRDLARMERRSRVGELRRADVPVVGWGRGERLGVALRARAEVGIR